MTWLWLWSLGGCAPPAPVAAPRRAARQRPRPPAPWTYARAQAALDRVIPALKTQAVVTWAQQTSVEAALDDFECLRRVRVLRRFRAPRTLDGLGRLPPLVTLIVACEGPDEEALFHLALGPNKPGAKRPLRVEALFSTAVSSEGQKLKLLSGRVSWSVARAGVALYTARFEVGFGARKVQSVELFSLTGRRPTFLKNIKLNDAGEAGSGHQRTHQLTAWLSRREAPRRVLVVSSLGALRMERPQPGWYCSYEQRFYVLDKSGKVLVKAPKALESALDDDPRVKRLIPRKGVWFCGPPSE